MRGKQFDQAEARGPKPGRALVLLLTIAAAAAAAAPARAQSLADLAAYSGPDRTQRLVDGARKEGTLTVYSSMTVADMTGLANGFQAKYGIKMQAWRGSSEDIRSRAMTEHSGGRYDVDVAETAGPDMEAFVREQVLQKIATPVSANLIPQATFAHGQWIATRLSVFAGAYNTNLIKAADVPKRYEDLLDAKWRGKLGIETDDANWFLSVCGSIGEEKCLKLFHDIVAKNGISVRKGHTLLANLVPTGEIPLALTAYSYRIEQLKKEGAPVEIAYLPPVVAMPTGAGVFKRAPHPHAALLFEDFILSDGQRILAEREAVPTDPTVRPLPKDMIFVDLPKYLDEGEKWTRLFKQTFADQSR